MIAVSMAPALLALAILLVPRPVARRLATAGLTARRHRRTAHAGRPLLAIAAAAAALAAVLLPPGALAAGSVIVATGVRRARRGMHRRDAERESRALQTALDVLIGELRAGAHPVAAVQSAAQDAGRPVGGWLRAVVARALLGAEVPAGLRSVCASSALPGHWERLAVSWELAQVHGLTMATLLRAAHRDIVERSRFTARAHAGMAGARATATILAVLPLVGAALGQAIGANPIGFLLGPGTWLLFAGAGLVCCGLLWSDRITTRVSP